MIQYIIENTSIEQEKQGLIQYLRQLATDTTDREVATNILDYLERHTIHNPFVRQPVTELPQPIFNYELIWNALDVIPQMELLNQERLFRLFEQERDAPSKKAIYEKKENVHNSAINSSTLSAARALIDAHGGPDIDMEYELRSLAVDGEKFKKAYTRIKRDKTIFGYENPFTLRQVFNAVIYFAEKQPPEVRREVLTILVAELERQSNKCSTGYLSALVSSLQGFQDDFIITMDVGEEMFARLQKFFPEIIAAESREDILEDVEQLRNYIFSKKNILLDEFDKEYPALARPEIETKLDQALERYAK